MAKKFYVLDSSKDISGAVVYSNYRLLVGSEIKAFFESNEKKGRRFIYQKLSSGDVIGFEVPRDKKKVIEAEIDREKYLKKVRQELDISILSLDSMVIGENEGTGVDIIPDESTDLENQLIEREEMEMLRAALSTLTEEELYIVKKLYLSANSISERELGKQLNIPRTTFNRRKLAILAKIKNNF